MKILFNTNENVDLSSQRKIPAQKWKAESTWLRKKKERQTLKYLRIKSRKNYFRKKSDSTKDLIIFSLKWKGKDHISNILMFYLINSLMSNNLQNELKIINNRNRNSN